MIIFALRDSAASVLLSISSLLLSLAILQYIYKKSVYSTFISVMFSSRLHSTYFVESAPRAANYHSITILLTLNLKTMGYKILICLLHILLGQQIYIQ